MATHRITVGLVGTVGAVLVVVADLGGVDAGAVVALELAGGAVVLATVIWLIRHVPAVILERVCVKSACFWCDKLCQF